MNLVFTELGRFNVSGFPKTGQISTLSPLGHIFNELCTPSGSRTHKTQYLRLVCIPFHHRGMLCSLSHTGLICCTKATLSYRTAIQTISSPNNLRLKRAALSCLVCTPSGIRTRTVWSLKPSPLPVGLQGHREITLHNPLPTSVLHFRPGPFCVLWRIR